MMKTPKFVVMAVAVCLALLPGCGASETAKLQVAQFRFDSSVRFQTIEGWGGLLANWHWVDKALGPSTPIPEAVEQELLRELVFDLGLNRFGVNFPAGVIERVNDNDNPHALNPSGFDFSSIEPYVREQLLPLRDLLRERGEPFVLYGNVILFQPKADGQGTPRFVVDDPEEYAEFSMAAIEFLRSFGLETDYWVIVNEPDLVRIWTPAQLAERVVLLGRRLRQAGYATRISAPETVQPAGVSTWLGALAATPEVRQYLGEVGYHSYDYDPTIGERPPAAPRAAVANWGRLLNLPVAQNEQGQAGKKNAASRWTGLAYEFTLDIAENIFADLVHANAAVWQMHAIIGWEERGSVRAAGTLALARKDGSGYDKPAQYWAARHFSRWLRPGAVRVGLHSTQLRSAVLAAAFLTPTGQPVIVAMNRSKHEQELRVVGLPIGRYTVSLTTRHENAAEREFVSFAAGQPLSFTMPAESVATFFVR